MKTRKKTTLLFLFSIFFLLVGYTNCSPTGGGGGDSGEIAPVFEDPLGTDPNISVSFQRLGANEFSDIQIDIQFLELSGDVSLADISWELNQGSLGELKKVSPNQVRQIIETEKSGEYQLKFYYQSKLLLERTFLVIPFVHEALGQGESVRGYVNTQGYEDGATVSRDGEWLFVQTGPHYFSGFLAMVAPRSQGGCGGAMNRLTPVPCENPWVNNTIGSYTSPERPGFFDGRIANGVLKHNSKVWNIADNQAPNLAMITMFYGFKRQADGSYKEPFYLAFKDENDGIMNPYGMSFHLLGNDRAQMLFTFDDPSNPDMVDFDGNGSDDAESYFDVYQLEVNLGENTLLGEFVPSGPAGSPPVRGSYFPSKLVDFGKVGIEGIAGTQGNPHIHYQGDSLHSIWTDDEFDSGGDHGEISVYLLQSGDINNANWQKLVLPDSVNEAGDSKEIQPFFDGEKLFFTRSSDSKNPEIYLSVLLGEQSYSSMKKSSSWSPAERLLGVGNDYSYVGQIVAIGEPTVAILDGKEVLYFVYGVIRGFDAAPPEGTGLADIDMQVGFIPRK